MSNWEQLAWAFLFFLALAALFWAVTDFLWQAGAI